MINRCGDQVFAVVNSLCSFPSISNGTPGSSNHNNGLRDDPHDQQAVGVEVTYDEQGNGQDELLWI